jgi:hypothetical protein
MSTYTDRQSAIERLRSFPDELERLVNPLTDAQLDQHPQGEWSVRQIVHHLADSHMSANLRFKKPLTEPPAVPLPVYDQDAVALLADYRLPLAPSLLILRGLHERFVALLGSLADEDWSRTGAHPEWGVVTVEYVAFSYAGHCDTHIDQINRRLTGK